MFPAAPSAILAFNPSGVTALPASVPVIVSALVANSTIPAAFAAEVSAVIVIVVPAAALDTTVTPNTDNVSLSKY